MVEQIKINQSSDIYLYIYIHTRTWTTLFFAEKQKNEAELKYRKYTYKIDKFILLKRYFFYLNNFFKKIVSSP